MVEAGHFGDVARLGDDELGDAGELRSGDPLHESRQQVHETIAGAGRRAGKPVQGGDEGVAHDRLEEVQLALVVAIEGRLGHPRPFGDLFETRLRVTLFDENRQRRIQQLLRTGLGAAFPAGRLRGVGHRPGV